MQKENLFIEAQNLINDFIEQKDVSKSKLSKKVGVNASVITFITNNQMDMVSDEMLLKVINTLKSKSTFNILGTSNYNTIFNICKDATKHHKLTGIIGYTGAGKSTALYDYYRSNKNVYYVECKNSMNRKQFLHEVLAELGVNFIGSVYEMVKLIVSELNSKSNPLLIIDEAGKLSTTLILDLHDLRNATINNAAIVMAGCEYFQKNLQKAANKDKTGYPEFYSRIVNWHILNRPTKAETAAICQHNGINEPELINEFSKLNNYRLLYNAIMNERAGI